MGIGTPRNNNKRLRPITRLPIVIDCRVNMGALVVFQMWEIPIAGSQPLRRARYA